MKGHRHLTIVIKLGTQDSESQMNDFFDVLCIQAQAQLLMRRHISPYSLFFPLSSRLPSNSVMMDIGSSLSPREQLELDYREWT